MGGRRRCSGRQAKALSVQWHEGWARQHLAPEMDIRASTRILKASLTRAVVLQSSATREHSWAAFVNQRLVGRYSPRACRRLLASRGCSAFCL